MVAYIHNIINIQMYNIITESYRVLGEEATLCPKLTSIYQGVDLATSSDFYARRRKVGIAEAGQLSCIVSIKVTAYLIIPFLFRYHLESSMDQCPELPLLGYSHSISIISL